MMAGTRCSSERPAGKCKDNSCDYWILRSSVFVGSGHSGLTGSCPACLSGSLFPLRDSSICVLPVSSWTLVPEEHEWSKCQSLDDALRKSLLLCLNEQTKTDKKNNKSKANFSHLRWLSVCPNRCLMDQILLFTNQGRKLLVLGECCDSQGSLIRNPLRNWNVLADGQSPSWRFL